MSATTDTIDSLPSAPARRPGGSNTPELRVGQVSENLRRWRKAKSALVSGICLLCALLVVTPLALVFTYLVIKGAGSINLDFFTKLPVPHGEVGGGVVHAILGSVILVGIAALIGLPTGVLGALYLTEYAGRRFASYVRFAADLLNGVPSIVWGIVAYAILVLPYARGGTFFSVGTYSAIAGSLALAFIMIPLVLRTTEEVLLLVPNGYREAAMALGIAKWRITLNIVFKTAFKGIVTGGLLAVARVSGETAPLLFTAFGNTGFSHSLKQAMAALPLQIYVYSISPYPDEIRQAWAAALVLLLLVLTLNVGVRFITRDRRTGGAGKKQADPVPRAATTAITGGAAVKAV